MAVRSVRRISEMQGSFRLDAEFWQPVYAENEAAVLSHKCLSLGDVAISVRKGIFYILANEYVGNGIPFLRSSNVGAILTKDSDLAFISAAKDREESKTSLRRGDIILSKTGKEGAAIVLHDRCNISQDVIGIQVNTRKINPFYLAAFLNSRAGVLQMRRWFQGQVQMHLTLPDARRVHIPIPPHDFQQEVESLIRQGLLKRSESEASYDGAENLLLKELGLADLDLSPQLFYERRYSETVAAHRLDAEYFSPRVQRALAKLRQQGKSIGDVAKLAKRRFRAERDRPFNYIEIGDVQDDGSATASQVAGEDAPSRAVWVVQPGDVITSTVRPIRRLSALIGPTEDGFVCSSGFAVLHPSTVPAELLLVYLRFPIIAEILDLHTTASMYPAISTPDLLKIPFLAPPETTALAIAEKVRESRTARQESQRLLADAKRMVEEMIVAGGAESDSPAPD